MYHPTITPCSAQRSMKQSWAALAKISLALPSQSIIAGGMYQIIRLSSSCHWKAPSVKQTGVFLCHFGSLILDIQVSNRQGNATVMGLSGYQRSRWQPTQGGRHLVAAAYRIAFSDEEVGYAGPYNLDAANQNLQPGPLSQFPAHEMSSLIISTSISET